MLRTIIGAVGFLIIAGTAGASDQNPFMPLWQITVQCVIGLLMFTWGVSKYWGEAQ